MRIHQATCDGCHEHHNFDDYTDESGFADPLSTCAYCEFTYCVEGSEKACYERHECPGHEPTKYRCRTCGEIVDILKKVESECLICEAKDLS